MPVWQPVTQIGMSSRKTNPEANETGNVLKNTLRSEEEDTEEPNLSLCPVGEVFKLAGMGSQVIYAGAQAPLLQRGQMLHWVGMSHGERLSAGRRVGDSQGPAQPVALRGWVWHEGVSRLGFYLLWKR